jgi:hypothetical protein
MIGLFVGAIIGFCFCALYYLSAGPESYCQVCLKQSESGNTLQDYFKRKEIVDMKIERDKDKIKAKIQREMEKEG